MSEKQTKQRLLDAAEELFAVKGFSHTSMREITCQAEANLASVNYYFGSKENLIMEILERKLIPINEKRLACLEQIREKAKQSGTPLAVSEIISAFMDPTVQLMNSGKNGQNFLAIMAQVHISKNNVIRNLFMKLIGPIFNKFYEELIEAMPDISKETVLMRFTFVIGAMIHTIMMTIHATSEGNGHPITKNSWEADVLKNELIGFATRGMG